MPQIIEKKPGRNIFATSNTGHQRDSSASTRARILAYLAEHTTITARDLSLAWGLTPEDIRYHLNELVIDHLVEICPRDLNQKLKRGRPIRSYRLAPQSTLDNFSLLSKLLLTFYLQSSPNPETAYKKLAEGLSEGFIAPANPTRRYNQAVTFLNEMQYHARWEAHRHGPRISLRSCPYAAILKDHPGLCQMDGHLLDRLFQSSLNQVARINLETGAPAACIFITNRDERA